MVSAQISPGELSNFHAKYEGISNCTKCHELGKHVNSSKCLDCHQEIKISFSEGRGFHSSSNVKAKECFACHSEHHGRNFKIIRFDKSNFDHNITGFRLTGKHAAIDCKECHQEKFIFNISIKRRNNSYLGLKSNCISCHDDFHQKSLDQNCLKCHNTDSFKPASGFNHNQSRFKLTGAHLKVECGKCHLVSVINNRKFQKFTGLSFSNCTPCHNDIHQGKFGKDCQKCHNLSNFKNIRTSAFDHSKTNFPLTGKHLALNCQSCHLSGDFSKRLQYKKCIGCHKDYHRGEFVKTNIQSDCSDCHNTSGFSPSRFSIEEHNSSGFQLKGSHLAQPCKSCHYKNNLWAFKTGNLECINCHENVHGSEISERFIQNNKCSNCHNEDSWRFVRFEHSKTGFVLEEKHNQVDCRSCHYRKEIKQYRFSSLNSDCVSCHQDIHQGQFRTGKSTDCLRCHSFKNWIPEKFNHELSRFSLAGAHQNIPCRKCHPEVHTAGISYVKYKLENFKCANCHNA